MAGMLPCIRRTTTLPQTFGLLAALLLAACAHHRGDAVSDDDGGASSLSDAGTKHTAADVCPPTNPYCRNSDASVTVAPSCGNVPIDLAPVGVNVMIAVEGAASMAPHWDDIQAALKTLRDSHPNIEFGLQVFWGLLAKDYAEGTAKSNFCGQTMNKVLDVGDNSGQALVDFMGTAPPGPSYVGGLFQTSPVIEPLNYYLENMTKLADPTRTNYLVFITDGNDNCFGSVFANKADKLVTYQKAAIELSKLNIRIIPVGFDQNQVPNASGIYDSTSNTTDLDVLSTLLKYGGSGLTEVPKVDDPTKLADVIAQVGQTVTNCRFSIPASLDPSAAINPFSLGFSVNGVDVARDRTETEGWNFVDANTSQVELFGSACVAVRAKAQLEAKKTCNTDVCGTAAIKVETKPRAVLFLLDSSGSRIGCADGTLGCLMLPDTAGRTSLTYWETVEHALSVSLTAPINDDIDFGLQFFPSKNAATFSCEVAATPEIPPANGTEITIMSQMSEKLPFGLSPVVQVLENVAAMPGRLADPTVQGAVVMLTDGGDNCSGDPEDMVVARLGTAAAKLLAAGVKTYVVRYGSPDGNTAEQDAELTAIVNNGGTAMTDPADPSKKPYINAEDDAALTAALELISNTLATCSFELSGLSDKVDKDNVNLYLNGEVIPFDQQNAKLKGWGWLDAAQTTVQLYGDSCASFENNRKTSVIVELGCASVLVI
ncbi:MAG: CglB [Myxococcaceae bacterium]|nr:CglB [Myxococcaceae bacterium]